MTDEEKISYVSGERMFLIRPLERLGLPEVYMSDASQGIHIRQNFGETDLSRYQPERSTAFPAPILLAATWNTDLAYRYAEAIGGECRAAGIGVLLGPGVNIYRQSQCGRNFEYLGEDPYLAACLVENYVLGLQSTGTAATLKHFVANNTEYFRRKSNSIVDERTLHEIYLPAFRAGIEAGAKAVMTAYNLLNGEWCGQSRYVISDLLREKLGFRGLVMTDWWSVHDGEKLVKSGQDLEMPHAVALKGIRKLLADGNVKIEDIENMVLHILRLVCSLRQVQAEDRQSYNEMLEAHEEIALQTAREGIVLLKNDNALLPLGNEVESILLTGEFVETRAEGGGSAAVEGFNNRTLLAELISEFGSKVNFVAEPAPGQIASADVVICSVGTCDSEGWDRPFRLQTDIEKKVVDIVSKNPNTVVIVNSGSGIQMTPWNELAGAILYAWYGGQAGSRAVVEILSGKTNPSGKLPITIERDFSDSPGSGDIPSGEHLYTGWNDEEEKQRPVYDITYDEGIFIGYRWYERQGISPLFPFGFGLSYTEFEYSGLRISTDKFVDDDPMTIEFNLRNTGRRRGAEIAQIYVQDLDCSHPRPLKELKGFLKVTLDPGENRTLTATLDRRAFAYWNPDLRSWYTGDGRFIVCVGSSSQDIRLRKEIRLIHSSGGGVV